MRLLVVEDEKKVAAFLQEGLRHAGYDVDVAYEGQAGLSMALQGSYDLLIVDVMLPRMNGLELVRSVRARGPSPPILMLTARTATEDKVEGLDSGADDYLTKPFALAELQARIRSLLRRGAGEKPTVLRLADLELDTSTRKARRSGKTVELTAKEYHLLEFLLRNREKTLTRAEITERIWSYDFDTGTNIIDVYVNHLRNKIDSGFEKKLIHTVRGVGYVMRDGGPG